MPWHDIAPFRLDQIFGYQSANRFRDNMLAVMAAGRGRYFGGTRSLPNHPTYDPAETRLRSKYPGGKGGPFNVENWLDVELDGTLLAGVTVVARVAVRTSNMGVTITPRVLNYTDGLEAAVGVPCIAGDDDYSGESQVQTLTLTLAPGLKTYRLQYTLVGVEPIAADTWCIGELDLTIPAQPPA